MRNESGRETNVCCFLSICLTSLKTLTQLNPVSPSAGQWDRDPLRIRYCDILPQTQTEFLQDISIPCYTDTLLATANASVQPSNFATLSKRCKPRNLRCQLRERHCYGVCKGFPEIRKALNERGRKNGDFQAISRRIQGRSDEGGISVYIPQISLP